MKIKFLFFAAIAAGMLVSCKNDNLVEDITIPAAQEENKGFDATGTGYVKVALNLPSQQGTRAVGDSGDNYGEFNDGIKNEYTVENVTLCIFSDKDATDKNDEMQYKLTAAYSLADAEWNMDGTNVQVTSNRTFVQQINSGDAAGSKLYAYVIINKHNFFQVSGEEITFLSGKDGDVPVKLNGKTLSEFSSLDLKESGRRYDANSFLMTNMPYANQPGGSKNPAGLTIKSLYPLDGAIYPTREAAEAPTAEAAEINVERVLAKVETTLKSGVSTTENNSYKFKFLGWFIDNTNPCTFIGRHSNAPSASPLYYFTLNAKPSADAIYNLSPAGTTYRFVSENPISNTQTNRYRTFFAIDANYNTNAFGNTDVNYNLINEGGNVVNTNIMKWENGVNVTGGRLRASGSHYYCTENTFDVNHQSESNTTRIVVVAQFTEADGTTPKSFYTISNEADKMYDKTQIINYAKGRIANRIGIQTWAHEYLKSTADAADYINIEIADQTESGRSTITVASINASDLQDADLQDPSKKAAAAAGFNNLITGNNEYLAANVETDFYLNGISYYYALIKHFGDYETPWSVSDHAGMSNTVGQIYDSNNEAKYLGRYGVVRNNWYKIEVEGIRQIGSAVVPKVPGKDPLDPDDPDTPDDKVENYLKVKINIMPWVIRKQSVTL